MKKHARKVGKLQLNRETVKKLAADEMAKAEGALMMNDAFKCSGCDSGCGIFE